MLADIQHSTHHILQYMSMECVLDVKERIKRNNNYKLNKLLTNHEN